MDRRGRGGGLAYIYIYIYTYILHITVLYTASAACHGHESSGRCTNVPPNLNTGSVRMLGSHGTHRTGHYRCSNRHMNQKSIEILKSLRERPILSKTKQSQTEASCEHAVVSALTNTINTNQCDPHALSYKTP